MIEKITSLKDLGSEEIYNDGRPFTLEFSTETALKNLVEKMNEVIEVVNELEK